LSDPYGPLVQEVKFDLKKLRRGIVQVQTELRRLTDKGKREAGELRNSYTQGFDAVAAAAKIALALAARSFTQVFTNFQQQIANVAAVSRASREEFARLEEAAREIGRTTRKSASEAADALLVLTSSGQNATQAIESLNGVILLAESSGQDLRLSSELVTTSLAAFGLEVDQTTRVVNSLIASTQRSDANLPRLAAALKKVAPVAASVGLSFEQTVAQVSNLINVFKQGEVSGTALRGIFTRLLDPSKEFQETIESMNLSLEDVSLQANSFETILDNLKTAGITASQATALFGAEASAAALVLLNTGGDALRAYTEEITNTQAASEALAIQNDTLAATGDRIKSTWEALGISLGTTVEPALRIVGELLADILSFLAELPKPVQILLISLGTFAATIGPIPALIQKVSVAIAGLGVAASANPLGLLIAALSAIAVGAGLAAANAETLTDKLNNLVDKGRALANESEVFQNQSNDITKLLNQYDRLIGKTKKTVSEQKELRDVITEIGKAVPASIKAFDNFGNAIDINADIAKNAADLVERADVATRKSTLSQLKAELAQAPVSRAELEAAIEQEELAG
jgi:TP901 family phage tail tape measure protein